MPAPSGRSSSPIPTWPRSARSPARFARGDARSTRPATGHGRSSWQCSAPRTWCCSTGAVPVLDARTFVDILRTNPRHRHHPGRGHRQRRGGGRGDAGRARRAAPQALQPRRGPGPHRRPAGPRRAGPERHRRATGDRGRAGPARPLRPAPDARARPPHRAGDAAPGSRARRGGAGRGPGRRRPQPARPRERRRCSGFSAGRTGPSPSSPVRPRPRRTSAGARTSSCSRAPARSTSAAGCWTSWPPPPRGGCRCPARRYGRSLRSRASFWPGSSVPGAFRSCWMRWRGRTSRSSRAWRCSTARG